MGAQHDGGRHPWIASGILGGHYPLAFDGGIGPIDPTTSIPLLALGSEDTGLVRDLAVIMAVAGVALVIFRLVRMPPVLGYLAAGTLIGPFTVWSPLVGDLDTIRLLADLGLVLLLFGIGLGVGWQRIRSVGSSVVIIGLVEMTIMFALGFEMANLLGWSKTESVFLGAALSISSSAILMTMLRESGELLQTRGQLIVGILVIEDIVAVILLTVLTGVATSGETDPSSIVVLAVKLATFGAVALVVGALVAPRVVGFVNGFQSQEALLITGLAMCFGLALIAGQLGLSPAVGAFLIGAVLGDTDHAEEMDRIMGPVRDMFAAIFFVSIGLLMDLSVAADFILPTLIVAAVFIVGKVLADTLGTLLAGHSGKESLDVGLGMPQVGEFSLAMVRVGVETAAIGSFLYPVMTGATAITALVYPFLFRGTNLIAGFLDRRSPRLLKLYGSGLVLALAALRSAFHFHSPRARRIQRSNRLILLNMGIISLFIAIGTGSLHFTPQLAHLFHLGENVVGLAIGGTALALSVPPALQVWKSLRTLSDGIVGYILPRRLRASEILRGRNMHVILRDSIAIPLLLLPAIWSIPLVSRLLSMGILVTPLAIAMAAGLVAGLAIAAFQIHHLLERTFIHTFLGPDELEYRDEPDPHYVDDDQYVYIDDQVSPEYTYNIDAEPSAELSMGDDEAC